MPSGEKVVKKELTGQHFGRLLVTAEWRRVHYQNGTKIQWRCLCDCGGTTWSNTSNLTGGGSTSCGCKQRENFKAIKTHGYAASDKTKRHYLYNTWLKLFGRCYNPRDKSFPYYGARGISICDRWRRGTDGLAGFECFLRDMGERPSRSHSIDRIDNNGNYEPANCRWATKKEQRENQRKPESLT